MGGACVDDLTLHTAPNKHLDLLNDGGVSVNTDSPKSDSPSAPSVKLDGLEVRNLAHLDYPTEVDDYLHKMWPSDVHDHQTLLCSQVQFDPDSVDSLRPTPDVSVPSLEDIFAESSVPSKSPPESLNALYSLDMA